MPPPIKRKGDKSRTLWTQTVSRNNSAVGMKFRPPQETPREATKGKLPCAEAASVQQVILMMVVHLCRKVIYGLDISYRICFYVLGTLLISVVGDYKSATTSRSYFGNPENFLNQWFVKLGWFWTCLTVGIFIYLTSHVISCGRSHIMKSNLARLGVATMAWYIITSLFDLIEAKSGMCEMTKYRSKVACVGAGYRWKGFDISGHCFLLIFSNLMMVEEGKAYLGWEGIKDFIRNEEHNRVQTGDKQNETKDTPLSKLKNEEFLHIRNEHPLRTPWVRLMFCMMAALMIFWDFMLLCTVLYFHMMIEKVVASGVAVLLWFSLYKLFYKQEFTPGLPAAGLFKYCTWKEPIKSPRNGRTCKSNENNSAKWSSKDDVPKFMGMPLYALKDYKEEKPAKPEDLSEEEVLFRNNLNAAGKRGSLTSSMAGGLSARGRIGSISEVRGAGVRSRSRSQSRSSRDIGSTSKNRLNHVNPVHF